MLAQKVFFQDDADKIASKPIMSYKEECEVSLQFQLGVIHWFGGKKNENTFPRIAKMARQYLGVPVTIYSASVERVFSGVGLTFADLRKTMKDSTLESICWIVKFMHAAAACA